MLNPNRFYVYGHYCKETGVLRYIGKGTGGRVNSTAGRNKKHKEVWDTLDKKILVDGLTEDEALDLEELVIQEYKDKYKDNLDHFLNVVDRKIVPHDMDYETLNNAFYYDETSSTCLRWKIRRKHQGINPGAEAGSKTERGYFVVHLDKVRYAVHRVIYVLHNKSIDKSLVVDHIDGDNSNNKIDNLQLVSQCVNSQNQKTVQQPHWHSQRKSWIASWTETSNGATRRASKCFNPKVLPYKLLPEDEAMKQAFEDAKEYQHQMKLKHYENYQGR